MTNSSVDDGQALLKPDDSRESTFPSSSQDDLELGVEGRDHEVESGHVKGDEVYYKNGVEIPSWIWQPIEIVNSCKGHEFCYYVKHIFKGMILQGCPLEVFVQLNLGHVNTFRKLRDSLKGQVAKDSWVNGDLRFRRGRKELATFEWRMRGQKIILDLVKWCKTVECQDPILCRAYAKDFEPSIPIEFVKVPYREIPMRSTGEKSLIGSRDTGGSTSKGNHERNRIENLDEYIKESVEKGPCM